MYSVSARAKGAFARKNKMAQGCVGECRLEVGVRSRVWRGTGRRWWFGGYIYWEFELGSLSTCKARNEKANTRRSTKHS